MSHPAGQEFIPSVYSRIVARELRLQERDLPALLRGTGLPTSILMPGDESLLSGMQQMRILENAKRLENAPDLGLRVGRQLQPSTFGPIGYLALSSPNLETALEALRDFLPLRISFAQLGLVREGDWLNCVLNIHLDASPEDRRMLIECFALVVQAVIESVLGGPLPAGDFGFQFARPGYADIYADYLHAPVRFGQGQNNLRIPAELAVTENASGDAASYRRARDMCYRLLDGMPAASLTMTDRVKRLLLAQPPGSMREADVASALFVSKRTLARRLVREGTSYRAIRDELLAQMAARHLRESDSSVEAVALLLGYHDAANFRRAFRRWYGIAPGAYRTGAGPAVAPHSVLVRS